MILEPDDADHLIDIDVGFQIAFKDVKTLFDLVQTKLRTPHNHFTAVLQKCLEHFAQAHHFGHTVIEHIHVQREPVFQI